MISAIPVLTAFTHMKSRVEQKLSEVTLSLICYMNQKKHIIESNKSVLDEKSEYLQPLPSVGSDKVPNLAIKIRLSRSCCVMPSTCR